jgi:excinuclease UvrABC ATPase subunit|tara:strand:- start:306 stop:545 length:240 start_codon:yes stop_codon:yes gene_type:complete
MSQFDIHVACKECDGYGLIETRVSVDRYTQRDCADCDGLGLIMHTETYDSVEDAKADYPESFIRPTKWNTASVPWGAGT